MPGRPVAPPLAILIAWQTRPSHVGLGRVMSSVNDVKGAAAAFTRADSTSVMFRYGTGWSPELSHASRSSRRAVPVAAAYLSLACLAELIDIFVLL